MQHSAPNAATQPLLDDHVHIHAEQGSKVKGQVAEVEEAAPGFKLHKGVSVAVRPGFVPSDGAEQPAIVRTALWTAKPPNTERWFPRPLAAGGAKRGGSLRHPVWRDKRPPEFRALTAHT